uniref:Uncharacterized protein n=1 Tax=Panagrolaimus sp. PS1159 TaxID=55785 RepID=A0AC35GB91_9BILA
MPPKRTADGFVVPALPKRFRAESAMPASRETSPATLRPRASSVSRAHPVNDKRLVPEESWKYGRNKFGAEKTHLIVFETPGNQLFARVYSLCNKIYWRCMGCRRIDNKATRAEIIDGNLYVPVPTFHRCRPKRYDEIREEQLKLDKKFAAACAIDEPMDENEDPQEPKAQANIIQFNHPSSEWLREKSDLMSIQYSTAAYQLWAKCEIDQISPTLLPSEIEAGTDTIFEAISMLFSGNKNSATKIEKELSKNFSSKYEILQKYKNYDFSKMPRKNKFLDALVFADEPNDFHFEFLARWLQVRIGIFENDHWKRFGNWTASDFKTVTVLLQKEEGKYQIVLKLE